MQMAYAQNQVEGVNELQLWLLRLLAIEAWVCDLGRQAWRKPLNVLVCLVATSTTTASPEHPKPAALYPNP